MGMLGIFLIIFAESGLFFGFFLPGDTLLFASGIFASQGIISLPVLFVGCIISAVVGYMVGYWFGHKVGKPLFERSDSFFFNKKRIADTEKFYEKHGPMTIILARFVPFVRTFAPIVAGVAGMNYKRFFLYNIIGGTLWVVSISLVGYYFGSLIPNIDALILPIITLVVLVSLLPVLSSLVYRFFKQKYKKD